MADVDVRSRPAPARPELIGITRRQFFNRSILGMTAIGVSGFGAAVLAFLWPRLTGAFGTAVTAGSLEEILQVARDTRQPVYVPSGRFYLVPYPADALAKAREHYSPGVLTGMEHGVVALYQRCPHLGCRVPFCTTSQWFECGCHQSKYNMVGERRGGPAPRGMDRFAIDVTAGVVTVDTSAPIEGPSLGTNTTGQEPQGPHCVEEVAE